MALLINFLCRLLLCLSALAGLCTTSAMAGEDFLAPEQAFAFSFKRIDSSTVRLHWDIAPDYHLYRDRINVSSNLAGVQLPALALPPGKEQFDANFNKNVSVYVHTLDVDLRIPEGSVATAAIVGWQGCADAGLCYAPMSASVPFADMKSDMASIAASAPPSPATTSSAPDSIASTLASGGFLRTMGVFWLAGLLLSFTPCVLPMIPILSSLIAGQSGPVSKRKGLTLALAYSFGMALVYAGFGIAAGLAGEGLAAALQNPWVLGSFALLLSVLAMSMFGFYELQMPGFIQNRALQWSNKFQGGSFIGVFLMGGISALVVGPCVAAPLAGALVYISQTRDVVLGGSALFFMAMGMSFPLLLLGMSAGSLLPRAGSWMVRVKQLFGMMMLGVAIWVVSPVLPPAVHMLLWAVWLLTAATLLGLFDAATTQQTSTQTAARATGAGLAILAVVLLTGAASGGQSVLQPLRQFAPSQSDASRTMPAQTALQFERISNVAALDAALAQAQKKGQTVMLDFYADWCVACKEFESFTFSNPEVQKRLSKVRLLQADVTANTAEDKSLLKRFSLFGPPGIVFFDRASSAVAYKVIGYQNAKYFLASLNNAGIP